MPSFVILFLMPLPLFFHLLFTFLFYLFYHMRPSLPSPLFPSAPCLLLSFVSPFLYFTLYPHSLPPSFPSLSFSHSTLYFSCMRTLSCSVEIRCAPVKLWKATLVLLLLNSPAPNSFLKEVFRVCICALVECCNRGLATLISRRIIHSLTFSPLPLRSFHPPLTRPFILFSRSTYLCCVPTADHSILKLALLLSVLYFSTFASWRTSFMAQRDCISLPHQHEKRTASLLNWSQVAKIQYDLRARADPRAARQRAPRRFHYCPGAPQELLKPFAPLFAGYRKISLGSVSFEVLCFGMTVIYSFIFNWI